MAACCPDRPGPSSADFGKRSEGWRECSIPDKGLRPRTRIPVAGAAARGAARRRTINPLRAESDRSRRRRSTVEDCVDLSASAAVYAAPLVLDGSAAVGAWDRTAFGLWRATALTSTD